MNSHLKPRQATDVSSEEMWNSTYDIALVALGFEQRSSHLANSLLVQPKTRIAVPFSTDRIHSYADNLKKLVALGYTIEEVEDADFVTWWISLLEASSRTSSAGTLKICIDISSLTRRRLAFIIEGLSRANVECTLVVDFSYTVAEFSPPPPASESATICGPVSSYLAGWPDDPDKPVAAIIGLGYEYEKAIGALEYLEPTTRILVKPISKDERFDEEVDKANSEILSSGRREVFSYPISSPTQCIELLDALSFRLRNDHRVVAIPFGPKMFALCSMLIACRYYPEIGIWRISADSERDARDQRASDQTVGLQVRFG